MKKEVKTVILTLDTYKQIRALRNKWDLSSLDAVVKKLVENNKNMI